MVKLWPFTVILKVKRFDRWETKAKTLNCLSLKCLYHLLLSIVTSHFGSYVDFFTRLFFVSKQSRNECLSIKCFFFILQPRNSDSRTVSREFCFRSLFIEFALSWFNLFARFFFWELNDASLKCVHNVCWVDVCWLRVWELKASRIWRCWRQWSESTWNLISENNLEETFPENRIKTFYSITIERSL